MAADDAAAPIEMLPPVGLNVAAAVVDVGGGSGFGCAPGPAGKVAGRAAAEGAEIRQPATPHTPQVSSKHWRKIRSAVVALAAFRSRRVKAADFERIRMCGEGGSGLVYLVRLKNTTMFFALKVQRKTDLEAKEKRIRRALIEKEVLVACAHPFVCSLYTAFQDSRHLYLLMDFCSGGDLKSLVRDVAKRALTEEEARFYVSEIVAALEWVHLHGYVYRDLKPENVLIHASGHIRLGDFGTAERGSTKCNDAAGGKLHPQDVEKALAKTSAAPSSNRADGKSGSAGAGHPSAASAAKNATPRAVVGANPPLRSKGFDGDNGGGGSGSGSGSGSGGHTFSEDDEADLEDYDIHGGANDGGVAADAGRPNSIIVQVDPLLAAGSASSMIAAASAEARAAEAAEAKSAAAAAAATAALPAVATSRSAADAGDVCADDGGDEGGGGGGVGSSAGCGCGRRRGGKDGGAPTSAAHAQPFAKGRGSVKLNVLLDSQTFIGTADFMAPEMVTGKQRQGTGMDWWALGVMLFEITLGTLPFHSELPTQSSNEIFRSIVNAELRFPRRHNLSHSAVDFIRQLLRKDPNERLGQRKGVGEIKRHPFFSSVHWALIANSTPPFVLSGPDTPGWLASVQPSSTARDDKMATWTWMATQQDAPRPGGSNSGVAASSGEAQDSLDECDSRSGRHRETDLDKLGDELGIAAERTGDARAATGAGAGADELVTTTTTGDDGDEFDKDGMPNHDPVLHSAVTTSAALAAAAAGKTAQRAGAAARNGGGGAAPAGATSAAGAGDARRRDHRASFDGYDFNTLRKVGSLRMASQKSQGGAGVPQLAAARSMGPHSSQRA